MPVNLNKMTIKIKTNCHVFSLSKFYTSLCILSIKKLIEILNFIMSNKHACQRPEISQFFYFILLQKIGLHRLKQPSCHDVVQNFCLKNQCL